MQKNPGFSKGLVNQFAKLSAGKNCSFTDSQVCSKCRRKLPLFCFAKGYNARGIYPSCRDCEKDRRSEWLEAEFTCVRCEQKPHAPHSPYCVDCDRVVRNKPTRSRTRRTKDTHMCPKCGQRQKPEGQPYCQPCKLEWQNKKRKMLWRAKLMAKQIDPEKRRIDNAKAYANGLLWRGKIKRGPCVFCGKPGTQFHHYDYEDRTRNFEDVCYPCHLGVHRFLEIVVDVFAKLGVKLLTVA